MAQWARRGRRSRRRGWPTSMYYYAEEADNDGSTAAGNVGVGVRCGDTLASQAQLVPRTSELLEAATEETGKTHGEEAKTE